MFNRVRYLFFPATLILATLIGALIIHKYQINQTLEAYTHEQVLGHVVKPKNIPLVEELYRLGNQVITVKGLKSKEISDPDQRKAHILLCKICKDSCLAIRCRLDPGLGHACRTNCPARKIPFCVTSLKPLPPLPSSK
jgi:hypothetical protein